MLKRSGALRAPKTSAIALRRRAASARFSSAEKLIFANLRAKNRPVKAFRTPLRVDLAQLPGRAAPMRAQKELSRGRLRHLLHGKRAFFLLHFADIAPPVGILSPNGFDDEVAKKMGKNQASLCGKTFGSKLRLEGQPAADNARLIAALMGTSFVKDKHSLHLLVQIKPNSQRLSAHPVRES